MMTTSKKYYAGCGAGAGAGVSMGSWDEGQGRPTHSNLLPMQGVELGLGCPWAVGMRGKAVPLTLTSYLCRV